ncbi:MAG: hypothetical protein ABIB61_02710 [Candidatus Shapirobacteria bacterium]
MNTYKNYILISTMLIVLAVGVFYIFQNLNQGKKILEVQLEVSAPFSTATLLASSQGTISYEAEAPRVNVEKQVDSEKIAEEQFEELVDLIIQNNFWSFNEEYFEDNLMDATTYTLSVKSVSNCQPELADARVYSVSCYGDCPEKIIEIINNIKDLWGKEILQVGI